MPNGMQTPVSQAFMKKPLAESLKQLGVAPGDIQHFALSHFHGDHSGNANYFGASTLYMQTAEYDAIFGAEPQKYNVPIANSRSCARADGQCAATATCSATARWWIKPAPAKRQRTRACRPAAEELAGVLSGDMVHIRLTGTRKRAPRSLQRTAEHRDPAQMEAFISRPARDRINHAHGAEHYHRTSRYLD